MLLIVGHIVAGCAHDTPTTQVEEASVERATIQLDAVRQGDMNLSVRALGFLTTSHAAELRVAESQIKAVQPNQPGVIRFQQRAETVNGKVRSVRSEVVNGVVTVDLELNGTVPQGIGAQAAIDGTIVTRSISNIAYVGRPAFGMANSNSALFKIQPDGNSAIRVKVQFGEASWNQIQIKSGLQPGDKVIVSDMSAFEKSNRITLK
jgi:HlyD family secretion protein